MHHVYFENFITSMVLLNTVTMAMVHYKMDPSLKDNLKIMNMFFNIVFNIEMILKLISLKGEYFYSNWNLFDMFIVISADFGILL